MRDILGAALDAQHIAQRDLRVFVLDFQQAAHQSAQHAQAAEPFHAVEGVEVAVEMLVVAHLVIGDAPRQVAQHRLVAGLLQGAVEGRGAGLDHAARGHLKGFSGLEFVDRAGMAVFLEEPRVAALPVEFGPDMFHIAPQGQAVLQLLRLPVFGQPAGSLGVGGVVVGQVAGIRVRAAFDEGRRHQQVEQLAIGSHPGGVDGLEIDVAQGPGWRFDYKAGILAG